MKQVMRVILAFLIAPFVGALVFSLHFGVLAPFPMAVALPVAYIAAVVLGLPTYLILVGLRLASVYAFALLGIVFVALPILKMAGGLSTIPEILANPSSLILVSPLLLSGLSTGIALWFIARPDLAAAKKRAMTQN
jgi:hypothetical protein